MTTQYINPAQKKLDCIFLAFQREWFSKKQAIRIVGGEKKLMDLIAANKIEVDKTSKSANGKWYCNAAQVIENCRFFKEL